MNRPGAPRRHAVWRCGCRLRERLVRAVLVEVRHVLAQHAGEVALAEDEHVVEALAPHAPQEALAYGVGQRRADRGAQDADPAPRRDACERRPVLAIVVADEEARPRIEERGLTQLPGDPGVGRVLRHADVGHAARAERDDEERVQVVEGEVGDREEVAGPDVRGVIAQEGRPRLPARGLRQESDEGWREQPRSDNVTAFAVA